MELMLLEDYKHGEIPQTIVNLMEFFKRKKIVPEKNDILVGLLHILMLEAGFVHKDCPDVIEDSDFNYRRLLRQSQTLPDNWKRNSSYRIDFILKPIPAKVCTLICTPFSDDLVLNCSVSDVGCFTLLLDPLTYFPSSKINLGNLMFQNLDHLACNFKNSIAFPAKVGIVGTVGGICVCFQYLPPELLGNIMLYLEISDLRNLAETCRSIYQATQNSSLWIKLLDRYFKRKNIVKTKEELEFLYARRCFRELSTIFLTRARN